MAGQVLFEGLQVGRDVKPGPQLIACLLQATLAGVVVYYWFDGIIIVY